jgi:Protein of unknown function (DUF3467)
MILCTTVEGDASDPCEECPSELASRRPPCPLEPLLGFSRALCVMCDPIPRAGCDTSRVNDENPGAERHINIHLSPEIMGGVYANFANVSHSDYEFTITFARVDHEVEDDEIPGVVVSRINLSAKFMRELIEAMQDNYSKWQTREGIKNLPEFDGPPEYEEESEPD